MAKYQNLRNTINFSEDEEEPIVADPIDASDAIDAQLGHEEQAVASDLPLFVVAHCQPQTPLNDAPGRGSIQRLRS